MRLTIFYKTTKTGVYSRSWLSPPPLSELDRVKKLAFIAYIITNNFSIRREVLHSLIKQPNENNYLVLFELQKCVLEPENDNAKNISSAGSLRPIVKFIDASVQTSAKVDSDTRLNTIPRRNLNDGKTNTNKSQPNHYSVKW